MGEGVTGAAKNGRVRKGEMCALLSHSYVTLSLITWHLNRKRVVGIDFATSRDASSMRSRSIVERRGDRAKKE